MRFETPEQEALKGKPSGNESRSDSTKADHWKRNPFHDEALVLVKARKMRGVFVRDGRVPAGTDCGGNDRQVRSQGCVRHDVSIRSLPMYPKTVHAGEFAVGAAFEVEEVREGAVDVGERVVVPWGKNAKKNVSNNK